ncbi:MAG: 4a-hydroxytetrahydrobiopterin dehydratase [Acidobacteria bacterium]|nr:4a-hydroxytetrahydrobiopterin dehydratase [Acidobacteriota bacterium]
MSKPKLLEKSCINCQKDISPLSKEEITKLLDELGDSWQVIEDHHLKKDFKFPNFQTALDFTNKVGDLAEKENHHPDIYLSWGRVSINIWTHSINGLSENDFILAAKISTLF